MRLHAGYTRLRTVSRKLHAGYTQVTRGYARPEEDPRSGYAWAGGLGFECCWCCLVVAGEPRVDMLHGEQLLDRRSSQMQG